MNKNDNPFLFGKSPTSTNLIRILKEKNDVKLSRKIGAFLADSFKVFKIIGKVETEKKVLEKIALAYLKQRQIEINNLKIDDGELQKRLASILREKKEEILNDATVTLFRPVGVKELKLIELNGFRAFPSRKIEQPIFYPVLNKEYARVIARDWNAKDKEKENGNKGFVLEFKLDKTYFSKQKVQEVGGKKSSELWIKSEDIGKFNKHIRGEIKIIEEFTSLTDKE